MRNAQSTHLNFSVDLFPIPIDREVIPQAAIAKGHQHCKECQRNDGGGWKRRAQVHDITVVTAHSYTSKMCAWMRSSLSRNLIVFGSVLVAQPSLLFINVIGVFTDMVETRTIYGVNP